MTNFQKFIQALENSKVPCNVKLFNTGAISVECGWNYPDDLYFQVDDIANEVGVTVEVCASVHGGVVEIQKSIAGGPKRYSF